MNGAISENVKIVKVKDPTADGTSDVTGDSVDLGADGGWDGVLFVTSYGTAAANNVIHAEGSNDNSSFSDLENSEVDAGGSDEDQFIDIIRPQHRYARPIAQRGTSSTLGDIWAVLYRGSVRPFSNVTSGTINGKTLAAPVAGTK